MGDRVSIRSSSSTLRSSGSGSAPESSKGGKDGREGISLSSIASILRQTLEGVSSIVAIAEDSWMLPTLWQEWQTVTVDLHAFRSCDRVLRDHDS